MSKKHYTNLAVVIRNEELHGTDPAVVNRLMIGIADICAADNPRFDRGRFYAACRVAS